MMSLLMGKRQPTLLIASLLIAVFFFMGLWHQEVTMERISYQFSKTLNLGYFTYHNLRKKNGKVNFLSDK